MQEIKSISDVDLILKIFRCDKEIIKMLAIEVDNYPGAIMGLADFYVEKTLLIDELLRRKNDTPTRYTKDK